MYKKLALFVIAFFFTISGTYAQDKPTAEVFCGAELSYADVNFLRLYNILIRLTPGAKIHLGDTWEIASQFYFPFMNEGYAYRNDMFRVNMLNVSKVVRLEEARQYFKLTAGLFGNDRFGGDLRWMYPVTKWLMVNARLGLTNHWSLGADLDGSSESEFATEKWDFTGTLGASVWLSPWNTEIRAIGGRYLNDSHGVEGEIIRHFNHCSVSLFAQLHQASKHEFVNRSYKETGGFRIVMMLPPYQKPKNKAVVFRPASNFRLTYNAQADGVSMQKYNTDPEENERTYPIRIPWGTGNFDE